MIFKRFFLAAALLAACGLVASANAANLGLNASVAKVETAPATDAAWHLDGDVAEIDPGQGMVFVTIEFNMEIADLAGAPSEVGFGNMVFDIGYDGVAVNPGFGYAGDTGLIDHDGNAFTPPVSRWAGNTDSGPSGTDLIDIIVELAPLGFVDNDARGVYGQSGPEFVGSIIATVDTGADVGSVGSVAAMLTAFSTYDDQRLLGSNDGATGGRLAMVRVGVVPEPTTCVLLGLGSVLMLVIRRKRS